MTEYKIKSHQREIFAEEESMMNNRANKEKKYIIKIIHIIDLDLSSLT